LVLIALSALDRREKEEVMRYETSAHRGPTFGRCRKPAVACLLVLLSVGVAGTSAAGTHRGAALRPLRFALSTPPLLDVTKSGALGSANTFIGTAYAPLLHMTPDGKFAPALAVRWRWFTTGRGNNKDFELTLRRNARFSDGSLVTAQAVVSWLQ
jgi:ABC-type transport system substrate-binding protein